MRIQSKRDRCNCFPAGIVLGIEQRTFFDPIHFETTMAMFNVLLLLCSSGQGAGFSSNVTHVEPSHLRASTNRMNDDITDADQSSFLEISQGSNSGMASMASYVSESESALSEALGPRWNGTMLDEDADQKTNALLNGISGSGRAIHGLIDAMQVLR